VPTLSLVPANTILSSSLSYFTAATTALEVAENGGVKFTVHLLSLLITASNIENIEGVDAGITAEI
jgi:hypothetical protein